MTSLKEALRFAGDADVYIAGGLRLYEEALPLVEKMYVTEIALEVEGDAYFPDYDEQDFIKEVIKKIPGGIPYTYVTYTRKQASFQDSSRRLY